MTSSALSQIDALLLSSDYYSAHQKARTTAARLLAAPRRGPASTAPQTFDKKAQEAAELLWESARRLLEKGQVGSGADLAGLLVGVWESREVECGDKERGQVQQLIALIGPTGAWRKQFTDAVFSWTSKTGPTPAGDEALHGYYGSVLFKEQDFHLASLHLLVCPTPDAARTLADVMFAWAKLDDEGESAVGRYAARGTLSYLEAESLLPARIFLSHYLSLVLSHFPNLSMTHFPFPPPSSALSTTTPTPESEELYFTKLPSLNFLQLLVRTCGSGSGESVEKVKQSDGSVRESKGAGKKAWLALVARYEKEVSWLRGAEVKESLQEIGQIYFGIKPPRPVGNPMMDMLSGLLGGR
ncbi:cytoplasmic protein [Meredithblackwellia eburnea MCA 4105]